MMMANVVSSPDASSAAPSRERTPSDEEIEETPTQETSITIEEELASLVQKIAQAKLAAQGGVADLLMKNFHRVRFDRDALKEFVGFLALPDVSMCLPSIGKSVKLESGETIELAKVVRLFSFREIYRMYIRYCEKQVAEFVKKNSLGFSTAYKLMEVLVPTHRRRLQCIDNYQADSLQAFDYLNSYINEMSDRICSEDREFQATSLHMSREFTWRRNRTLLITVSAISYLIRRRASPCNQGPRAHTHERVCTDCLECTDVFDVFIKILKKDLDSSIIKQESIRIARMIEQMDLCKNAVEEYRTHQIRAFSSELHRKVSIENLQPGEAFIVSDFSLKFPPISAWETQAGWFGKTGISIHLTYAVANIGGVFYHHTFTHPANDLSQDHISTSAITEHVLQQLHQNVVRKATMRYDNTIEVIGYKYSENQAGKGQCDRKLSTHKGKIRYYVDACGNARDAEEIVEALSWGTPLQAASFHEFSVSKVNESTSNLTGIQSYGAFKFEKNGVRVWKYDQIGEGMFIPESEMIKNEYKYAIGKQGGCLSYSVGFWKKFDDDEDKEVESNTNSEEDSSESKKGGIFCCSDRLCSSHFLIISGLAKHELLGKRRRRKNSEDTGYRFFANLIETDTAAAISVKSDSLASIASTTRSLPPQEWAMQRRERATAMTDAAKEAVEKYFHERRGEGRKAVARQICDMIRDVKDEITGEYMFPLVECPKESQCQTQISKLLRGEKSAGSRPSSRQDSRPTSRQTNSRKRGSITIEENSEDDRPSTSKKGKETSRPNQKVKTVLKLQKEKLQIFEDDEFAD